jgi:predicted molibdopterin-dependent oxidoreductase YjgC
MTAEVEVRIDGVACKAVEGVPLGAVLHARGGPFRRSPAGGPRALWCGMGVCLECRVEVDGRDVRACLVPVRAGMVVRTGGDPR